MSKHGGARKGAGRKKGVGITYTIRKHCEHFIKELLTDEAIRNKAIKDLQASMFDEDQEDYLYIIENNGLYKLGYSSNLKKRYKNYETHLGEVKLIYATKQKNCFELEALFHEIYSDFRVKGEWFDLRAEHIDDIISTCSERLIN